MVRKYTILHGIFEQKYIIDILKKDYQNKTAQTQYLFQNLMKHIILDHGAIQSLYMFCFKWFKILRQN